MGERGDDERDEKVEGWVKEEMMRGKRGGRMKEEFDD